jgi:hypothetical protein
MFTFANTIEKTSSGIILFNPSFSLLKGLKKIEFFLSLSLQSTKQFFNPILK